MKIKKNHSQKKIEYKSSKGGGGRNEDKVNKKVCNKRSMNNKLYLSEYFIKMQKKKP